MDSALLTTLELDPRDKKKFYFADTSQRRALIILARLLFAPVMKMDVHGLENFPQRARVQITLLPPLHPKVDETPLALTDRLMFTLAQALPAEIRGVYAEVPQGFKPN